MSRIGPTTISSLPSPPSGIAGTLAGYEESHLMKPCISLSAASLGLLFTAHTHAQSTELETIKVTATRVVYAEADAAYAA